jgi:nucleoside phosphorylase
MPIELGPLLAQEKVQRTVTVAGHDFFVGTLKGRDVVLSLTGIGPVNATRRTQQALRTFRCGGRSGINAVVFSGVAGGDWIGNVIVPDRWTLDHGKTFIPVQQRMLATAHKVARSHVALEQKAPAGDPACGCVLDPDTVGTATVTHKPHIEVGGAGDTTDPFSGRALPCAPGGGDVFGCEPCVMQGNAEQASQFGAGVVPFADPSFFTGYSSSTATNGKYVAEDEETAAVATVAAKSHLPFIGFRAVSDGGGDPLHLPGFPVQFFYYRQLAADNAASVTLAFLGALRA